MMAWRRIKGGLHRDGGRGLTRAGDGAATFRTRHLIVHAVTSRARVDDTGGIGELSACHTLLELSLRKLDLRNSHLHLGETCAGRVLHCKVVRSKVKDIW